MKRHSTDPDLTEQERDVLERLEATGWFVNKIASDQSGPGFAYSFGLYGSFQHPEIILFGLQPNVMQQLINDIGKQIQNGVRYTDGYTTSDLLEDYICRFQRVDPRWYNTTLTWAGWFYKSWDFPALQLVWPDRSGAMPWDQNCMEWVLNAQLDLSKPPKHQ